MSNLQSMIEKLNSKFRTRNLPLFNEESGITYENGKEIRRVGYCTNLTPQSIREAASQKIDLLLTHHDAWHFIFGLKEECLRLLEEYKISHYFNHAPLDDCEFGTNSSLSKELGLVELKKVCETEGFECGVICEFPQPLSFEETRDLVEEKLGEKVLAWQFQARPIQRVCIICGAGHLTTDMQIAVQEGCDLYITGEKILYTVEYAQLHKLNLIVGSHTFTELFGVRSMAEKLLEEYPKLDLVLIKEEHLEADGMG